MESIIITVTNLNKRYYYDLDVPVGITVNRLKSDMVEALNGYHPEFVLQASSVELFSNRLGRQLGAEETLETAGVWNGDYITIIEV